VDRQEQIDNLTLEINERQWTHEFDVRSELEDGKPKYKNEAAREMAVNRLMGADEGSTGAPGTIRDLEETKQRLERGRWKMKDEFSNLKPKSGSGGRHRGAVGPGSQGAAVCQTRKR